MKVIKFFFHHETYPENSWHTDTKQNFDGCSCILVYCKNWKKNVSVSLHFVFSLSSTKKLHLNLEETDMYLNTLLMKTQASMCDKVACCGRPLCLHGLEQKRNLQQRTLQLVTLTTWEWSLGLLLLVAENGMYTGRNMGMARSSLQMRKCSHLAHLAK